MAGTRANATSLSAHDRDWYLVARLGGTMRFRCRDRLHHLGWPAEGVQEALG